MYKLFVVVGCFLFSLFALFPSASHGQTSSTVEGVQVTEPLLITKGAGLVVSFGGNGSLKIDAGESRVYYSSAAGGPLVQSAFFSDGVVASSGPVVFRAKELDYDAGVLGANSPVEISLQAGFSFNNPLAESSTMPVSICSNSCSNGHIIQYCSGIRADRGPRGPENPWPVPIYDTRGRVIANVGAFCDSNHPNYIRFTMAYIEP